MSTRINPSDAEARERIILWIRKRMDESGITVATLEQVLQKEARQPCYKDAFGHCWMGEGGLPEWLARAVAAGQSIEHFRTSDR